MADDSGEDDYFKNNDYDKTTAKTEEYISSLKSSISEEKAKETLQLLIAVSNICSS